MDKFVEVLEVALAKLGVAAVYIWPKAVLYTLTQAIADTLGWALFGVFIMYSSRLLWQRADYRDKEEYGEVEGTAACRVISWILFFFGPFIICLAVFTYIPTFISPEYATVLNLISAARTK